MCGVSECQALLERYYENLRKVREMVEQLLN
jgi:hypothetical protein